ncbi:hypothetical protein GQT51_003197 [Salmonella enterica]|nr:hypothetical protein [Salmonella enterica subsp. enterica serovar Abony]EDU9703439.1 hypothetical protein [Salmonella enterica subsp. salamae]EDW3007992.1 hypothetical protein [Salmonella enterica subsp. enterica serovar Mikawasima]EDY6220825.1 hypothetical protein [Salmonella enterica]EDV0149815.1 hypothetical protein [Salmonella enterica subsp. enterica serovar Abony]
MLFKSSLRCGASVASLLPCADAHKSPFLSETKTHAKREKEVKPSF